MKILKNNLKVIIAFIFGLILAGGIVYAATSADKVTYTTTKNSEIQTVEEALNDLYNTQKNMLNGNKIIAIDTEDNVSSVSCSVGDYFFLHNIYGGFASQGWLHGAEILATCCGPELDGKDSTGVLVRAISNTITCDKNFGYIKLGIQ